MDDSLEKLAADARATLTRMDDDERCPARYSRKVDEWIGRLDAMRERLTRADNALCEEMASKHGHSPGIIGNQIQRLRSIAGETEKGKP